MAELILDLDRNRSTPVYKQIEDQLREKILRGELPAGSCLPNGQQLSKSFGVAYRTVLRSLNRLKKQGLLRGVPSLGTFVQAVPSRKVQNIAITFDRSYQHAIARDVERFQRGIMAACGDHFHLQLFPLHNGTIFSEDEPTLLARMIEDWHIHGVITYSAAPPEDIDRLMQFRIPTVTSRDIYPGTDVPWVMEDVEDGAKKLVHFLVAGLGHRRISLVMGPRPRQHSRVLRPSGMLAEALVRELSLQRIVCPDKWILYSDFRWESVAKPFHQMLAAPDRPTAIIFADDSMAMEGLKSLNLLNLSVPRDISVASYGDFLSPDTILTAIHLPMEEVARRAVSYLEELTQGRQPTIEMLPVELMIRQTCGSAPR